MVVAHGFEKLPSLRRPTAVAVGNFDGLHLGHRKILARLCELSRSHGLLSLVLTFDPHPERALGKKAVRMIDTPDQRLARLGESCVDTVLVTGFDRTFSALSGREFVERILLGRLRAREIVVGRDFRYGKNRRSDIADLRELGRRLAFGVHAVAPRVIGGAAVSSSAIRRLLARGRVEEASRLLGRPYEIAGTVASGDSRGTSLGFPTANLLTDNEILPDGVFISESVWKGRSYPSVTSIGTNPTFGPNPVRVETHLLDRRARLLGAGLSVRLLRKIRPTRKFQDPQALVEQIGKDVAAARAYFRCLS
ncbi:MAG: bifunctional riboflavin kinase/FAD synthetase [Candidatus Aminicenantales bacterium]